MKQAHVAEFYTAYLDDALPDDLREQVEAHLHACPRCAAELTELRGMIAMLRELPEPALPAGFVANVRERVAARRTSRLSFWRMPALASGLAAVLVAVTFLALRQPPATLQMANTPAVVAPAAPAPPEAVNSRTAPGRKEMKGVAPHLDAQTSPSAPSQPVGTRKRVPEKVTISADRPAAKLIRAPNAEMERPATGNRVDIAAVPKGQDGRMRVGEERGYIATDEYDGAQDAFARSLNDATPAGAAAPTTNGWSVKDRNEASAKLEAGDELTSTVRTDQPEKLGSDNGKPESRAYNLPADGKVYYSDTQRQAVKLDAISVVNAPKPSGKVVTVTWSVAADEKSSLTVDTLPPATMKTQHFELTANGQKALAVQSPVTPDGAVQKLTLREGDAVGTVYLVVPGTAQKPRTTLNLVNHPAIDIIRRLATDAGIYATAPAALAESVMSYSIKETPALQALTTFAARHGYQTRQTGNVVKIDK